MGATPEIAESIGSKLRKHGHEVEIIDPDEVVDLSSFEAVVIGSPMMRPFDRFGRMTVVYDPFERGSRPIEVRNFEATDTVRGRVFPIEVWHPAGAQAGRYPLVVYSHSSGGHRRVATFLTSHLASHGYLVAAMDHSEMVAPELSARTGETGDERDARIEALIGSRVPDIRFLLDHLLGGEPGLEIDPTRIGLAGHSFGGWTVLAAAERDPRISAVVAMAPGGATRPRPGILPLRLDFAWDAATLYLVALNDTPLPLAGMYELFDRTKAPKRMVILHRADHSHFVDDVEGEHERVRAMSFPDQLAWLPREMLPISELSSGEQAHLFVRGLTLAHFDAVLQERDEARQFWNGDVEAELARLGVEASEPPR
jgi:dienelactone hydrolase